MWCNSALEELGLRNLCPVVLHFDLLASFTSQVIPPTIVNDKSCLSLHSCKKRLQVINLLQLLSNGSVTVCQAPQMNTPKYQLVALPAPQFQTSACVFECCQSCDYHSVVPSLTLRNNVCLFSLAGHKATGSLRCDHKQHPVILSTHQRGPCHTRQH